MSQDGHTGTPTGAEVAVAVAVFRLLVDPARLRMLWALSSGDELDVTSLAEVGGISPTAASQHLAKLRLAGAVDVRRDGRRSLYSIRGVHLRRVIAEALSHADHAVSGLPPHN